MFNRKLSFVMAVLITINLIGINSKVYAESTHKVVFDSEVSFLSVNGETVFDSENDVDFINSNFNLIVSDGAKLEIKFANSGQLFVVEETSSYNLGEVDTINTIEHTVTQDSIFTFEDISSTDEGSPVKVIPIMNEFSEGDFSANVTTPGVFSISFNGENFGDSALFLLGDSGKPIQIDIDKEYEFDDTAIVLALKDYYDSSIYEKISDMNTLSTVNAPAIIGEHNGLPIIDIYSGMDIDKYFTEPAVASVEDILNDSDLFSTFLNSHLDHPQISTINEVWLNSDVTFLSFTIKESFLERLVEEKKLLMYHGVPAEIPSELTVDVMEDIIMYSLFDLIDFLFYEAEIEDYGTPTVQKADAIALVYLARELQGFDNSLSILDVIEIDEQVYRDALGAFGVRFNSLENSEYLLEILNAPDESAIQGYIEYLNSMYPELQASYTPPTDEDIADEDLYVSPMTPPQEYMADIPYHVSSLVTTSKLININPYNYVKVDLSAPIPTLIMNEVTDLDLSEFSYYWVVSKEDYRIYATIEEVGNMNSPTQYAIEDLNDGVSVTLVITDKYGFNYFTDRHAYLPIHKNNLLIEEKNIVQDYICDTSDADYIYYDLRDSDATAMDIDIGWSNSIIDLTNTRQFYVPKKVSDDIGRLDFISEPYYLDIDEDTPIDEFIDYLYDKFYIDGHKVDSTEIESYTSPMTGENAKAYKLQAIKDGQFLQSLTLEYNGYMRNILVDGEFEEEPVIVLSNVSPEYGPVFRTAIPITIIAEGGTISNYAHKFMSGIIIDKELSKVDKNIEDAYMYIPITNIQDYITFYFGV